jgi:hypothetical protein
MATPTFITENEKSKPLNLSIIQVNKELIDRLGLKKVESLDIFNKSTGQFHETGLFSTEIFGKPLSKSRYANFAYIDLRIEVLHPIAYLMITKMSSFYKGVLEGKRYAVYDKTIRDLVETSADEGETGFKFFIDNLDRIDFKRNKSRKRNAYINFLYENKESLKVNYFLVLPAGQREYIIDDTGKPTDDEFNTYYRKIIYVAESIDKNVKPESEYLYDTNRLALQNAIVNLYNYTIGLLKGKNMLVYGKWASRKMFNSSRNVITPGVVKMDSLHGPRSVNSNNTIIGLYQYCRNVLPMFYNRIKVGLFSNIFLSNNGRARVVDKKTLKSKDIDVSTKLYDSFMTYDGFENFFDKFSNRDARNEIFEIGDGYACLIYRKDGVVKLLSDIDQYESLDKDFIKPANFYELFYIFAYDLVEDTPCFITRYPVTGYGSIYPSIPYVKVSDDSEIVTIYDLNGNKKEKEAPEFPLSDAYFDTVSPSPSALARLGGDYDGDTVSCTCTMTVESAEEVKLLLGKKSYYVSGSGEVYSSMVDDIVDLAVKHLTTDVS